MDYFVQISLSVKNKHIVSTKAWLKNNGETCDAYKINQQAANPWAQIEAVISHQH